MIKVQTYILFLVLIFSTVSKAQLSCKNILSESTGESSFVGFINFFGENSEPIRLHYTPYKKRTSISLADGEQLLTLFRDTFRMDLPGTQRVEEKAVISKSSVDKILRQGSQIVGKKWRLRDRKKIEKDNLTITGYAKTFKIDIGNAENAIGKVRIRKYYEQSLSDRKSFTEVFSGISSLEIKIDNVNLNKIRNIVSVPNLVFKPRIFITDEQLVELKSSLNDNSDLSTLKTEIANLTNSMGERLNDAQKTESFLNALEFLSKKVENILDIQEVISYNRDSFKIDVNNQEFQFTVDRNAKFYAVDPKIQCCDFSRYIEKKSLNEINNKLVFAELKSPLNEVQNNSEIYKNFRKYLLAESLGSDYKMGSGKFSLMQKYLKGDYEEFSNIINQKKGVLFWLVHGTRFLPEPPNRKKITEHGKIDVAIPVKVRGQDIRVLLSYKPFYDLNQERSATINSVEFIGPRGEKIDFSDSNLVDTIKKSEERSVLYFRLDDQLIAFKPRLDHDELKAYKEFFSDFYKDFSKNESNPRELEDLKNINSIRDLNRYYIKMKMQNLRSYIFSRLHRVFAGALLTGAVVYSLSYFNAEQKILPELTYVEFTGRSGKMYYNIETKKVVSQIKDIEKARVIALEDLESDINQQVDPLPVRQQKEPPIN